MPRIMELGLLMLLGLLSGCAAIQGAHGDAAVAKQTAAAQAASGQTKSIDVDSETIAPPIQQPTAAQGAATEAAKIIAPLH